MSSINEINFKINDMSDITTYDQFEQVLKSLGIPINIKVGLNHVLEGECGRVVYESDIVLK